MTAFPEDPLYLVDPVDPAENSGKLDFIAIPFQPKMFLRQRNSFWNLEPRRGPREHVER